MRALFQVVFGKERGSAKAASLNKDLATPTQ